MSLLNQVLRDLDSRHASVLERQRIPDAVRPLPVMNQSVLPPRLLILAGAALAIVAVLTWLLWPNGSPAPSPALPAPVTATAPVPAPPAPVPAPAATAEPRELKLDASELFAAGRPAAPSPTSAAAGRIASVASTTTGSGKSVPLAEARPPVASEQGGNVVIAPRGGDAEGDDYRRAQSLIEHGAAANAEPLLRQILDRNPSHQAARQSLFNLLAANRRIDEAASLLSEGLRLEPSRTGWAMNLARLQIEQGDNEAAWKTLQRSLPHATNQGDYQAFCGTVLQKLKKPSEAAERYQAALRINPGESRWWIGLALALEAMGKPAESREAFARARSTGKLTPELSAYVESKLKQ